jgi:hypothetical protein
MLREKNKVYNEKEKIMFDKIAEGIKSTAGKIADTDEEVIKAAIAIAVGIACGIVIGGSVQSMLDDARTGSK